MNLKSFRGVARYGLGIALVLVLAVTLAGQPGAVGAQVGQALPSISGNIGNQAIEIDDLDDDPNTTPDANMEPGTPDTCPGSPDPDCPLVSGATYIDWNDLAPADPGEHVFNDGSGSTDDSFAGTSTRSCLQPAHAAPQKEDILRVYMADNGEYLYLGLVDLSPTGDSRHVILFHKNPVQLGEKCAGDGQQMRLQLTNDDKLIRATFKPSADEPAAQVYSVVPDSHPLMYMDEAANYFNTALWTPTAEVANFAVNLADLTDDLGGGVNVPAETFGEAAVALSDLGVPPCGASYNVSIITRSSGSGGGESKDYVGGIYTFPSIYVAADLIPRCDDAFDYSAQAYYDQALTMPIDTGVEYAWSCDPAVGPPTGQSGTVSGVADGTYTCTVTASLIDAPVCNASDSDTVPVSVLGASATLDDSCTLTFDYSSGYSGALGAVSYSWAFSGPTTVTPTSSTDPSGTAAVAAPGGDDFTGNLTVTDSRTDTSKDSIGTYVCYAYADDTADVYGPISVYIAPDNTSLTCPLVDTAGTDVTYTAYASGGKLPYVYTWSVTGDNTAPACGDSASCLVDSAATDYCAIIDVQVTVDDGFGLCDPEASETEAVTKITEVTASDN